MLLVLITSLLLALRSNAADPQPYKVDMASTGDNDMNATLKATSDLITLRTSAPVGPFGLIGRARSDLDRLKTVLESYGYYQSYVGITIDGLPLDDPTLGGELSARSKDNDALVKVTFSIGPLYHLRKVEIDGEIPKSVSGALALRTGDPAIAADVLAAGTGLQTALEDEGYAFAKVDPPVAHEIPDERVLDVSFHAVTGQKVDIGTIHFEGLKRVREQLVQRRLLIHQGEQYGASKVERARKDLLALGVFTAVSVELGPKPDSSGQVPITFRVRERLQHAMSVNGAYSTDLGGSTGVTWTNRNVSGRADQLTLAASVINLGGSASNGIGYDLNGKYLIPEFAHRDQSLQFSLQAINQFLAAYDQKALIFGTTLSRRLSSVWTATVGITATIERIGQEGFFQQSCPEDCNKFITTPPQFVYPDPAAQNCASPTACEATIYTTDRLQSNYRLVALPFGVTYNSTGLSSPIEDPTHGIRASFSEAPTISLGSSNAKFFITQANFSFYLDLHDLHLSPDEARSIVAFRAVAGIALGASQFSLPPDQRFYAGGSGTIRGYRYQSVGPAFPRVIQDPKTGAFSLELNAGNPIGGTAMNAGSIEYRQRIGKSLGFAVFVDGGQASGDVNPLNAKLRFGAGAGARYYTPIGPIRVDFALPVNKQPHDDSFEIYIGLGQAF
jgi:translocation and assembly module TamA